MSRCRECGERWPQTHGLCRTCERFARAAGRLSPKDRNRQAETVFAARPPAPPLRTYLIDGIEYDVLWDGSEGALLEDRWRC
jgi:hypothetical protein